MKSFDLSKLVESSHAGPLVTNEGLSKRSTHYKIRFFVIGVDVSMAEFCKSYLYSA